MFIAYVNEIRKYKKNENVYNLLKHTLVGDNTDSER